MSTLIWWMKRLVRKVLGLPPPWPFPKQERPR